MRYTVTGADRQTGAEKHVKVNAESKAAAEQIANEKGGILVSNVVEEPPAVDGQSAVKPKAVICPKPTRRAPGAMSWLAIGGAMLVVAIVAASVSWVIFARMNRGKSMAITVPPQSVPQAVPASPTLPPVAAVPASPTVPPVAPVPASPTLPPIADFQRFGTALAAAMQREGQEFYKERAADEPGSDTSISCDLMNADYKKTDSL